MEDRSEALFPSSYDDEGLEPVVRAVRPGLLLYLNGILHDWAEAEDIAAEAFLKLLIRQPRFPSESALRAWLYKVGRNLAFNFLRKQKNLVIEEELADRDDASRSGAEEILLAREERQELYDALEKLSPDYREILWLDAEGLSHAAIAEITKKSRRQVEKILYRGRKLLREMMKGTKE